MKTSAKKQRISNEQFRELLIKELAKPDSSAHLKTNFYELLQTMNYSINKQRALKLHDLHYPDLINGRNGKLEGKTLEKEIEALEVKLNDKNVHAKTLLDQVKKMQDTIQELEKVKVSALNVRGTLVITTQSDVTKAKNEIRAHYSEIRAILKQIGEWYGFNAPKQTDLTTGGEKLSALQKQQPIQIIIKERIS